MPDISQDDISRDDVSRDDVSRDEATYENARLLFVSIASSPLFLAGVLWFGVGRTEPAGAPGLATWAIWGLFTLGGLAAWLLFRRKAVDPVTEWSGHRRRAEGFDAAALQTHLVVAWAGAEIVGFAGAILYFFLGGDLTMLVGSLVACVLCFALSAPRKEWFDELRREGGAAAAG